MNVNPLPINDARITREKKIILMDSLKNYVESVEFAWHKDRKIEEDERGSKCWRSGRR